MARTTKTGLDYFPFDVDFFDDEKLQFLSAKFGIKGEIVAIKLLCRIYRNGYCLKWGKDEAVLFAKRAGEGITYSLIMDIVEELTDRCFFDRRLLSEQGILTSRGIQNRFLEATKRRKDTLIPMEHYINSINGNINPINVDINPLNVDKSTQRRVKESKGKESESKEDEFPPRPDVENFFFEQKQLLSEANKFYDYYSVRNWKIEDEPILDWKAAARMWIAREPNFKNKNNGAGEAQSLTARKIDDGWKDSVKKTDEEIRKHGKFKKFDDYKADNERLPI